MKILSFAILLTSSFSLMANECENLSPAKKILTEAGLASGATHSIEVKIEYSKPICHTDGGVTFTDISVKLENKKLMLDSTSASDFCSLFEMRERDRLSKDTLFPKTVAVLNNQGAGAEVPSKIRKEKYWALSQLVSVTCEN